jgi:hypothetical protein
MTSAPFQEETGLGAPDPVMGFARRTRPGTRCLKNPRSTTNPRKPLESIMTMMIATTVMMISKERSFILKLY